MILLNGSLDCSLAMELNSGILISVPIPESAAADGKEVEEATQTALKECNEQEIIGTQPQGLVFLSGLIGRDVTPYVLKRVAALTSGRSLAANLALIKNNAHIASLVAVELAKLQHSQ